MNKSESIHNTNGFRLYNYNIKLDLSEIRSADLSYNIL